jgi:hypothetical protein
LPTPSPARDHPVAVVGDAIVKLLEARDLETARDLLELLIGSGHAPPMMLVAYAVCLAELGESARAAAAADLARSANDPGLVSSGLLEKAGPLLPGGAHSKDQRDAFRAEAEKWLPRGPKAPSKGGSRERR